MTDSALDCGLCMSDFFADPMAQIQALDAAREGGPLAAEEWFLDQYADGHNEHGTQP